MWTKVFQPRHAGLEDVFDDLKIEANEGDMVDEFDNVVVGNDVMLNRNDPKVKKREAKLRAKNISAFLTRILSSLRSVQ